MQIILWLIRQLPFTATRVLVNVVQFLKNELFAGAFSPIERRFKYFVKLTSLFLEWRYKAFKLIEQIIAICFFEILIIAQS